MEDVKFNTLQELYNRLKPALNSKIREYRLDGFKYISIEDLWNYLRDEKWVQSADLDLAKMVDDIFHIEVEDVVNYRRHH